MMPRTAGTAGQERRVAALAGPADRADPSGANPSRADAETRPGSLPDSQVWDVISTDNQDPIVDSGDAWRRPCCSESLLVLSP